MFKNWSIRRLLQFWASIMVIVVIIMTLMVNYAHSLIESSRQALSEQLLPVDDSGYRLGSVVSTLGQRQRQMLSSNSLLQLEQLDQRAVLEQQFQQNWLRLTQLFEEESEHKQRFDNLFAYYQDFLDLDDELFTYKQRDLILTQRIRQLSQNIDMQSASIRRLLDELEKLFRERNLLTMQATLQPLKLSVNQLIRLGYQSFVVNSDDELLQLEQQQTQLISEIKAQSKLLEKAMNGRIKLSDKLAQLIKALDGLFESTGGEGGLFALQQQYWLVRALRQQSEAMALSVMQVMQDNINLLAASVRERTYNEVTANVQRADTLRWQIITLSLLITLVMIVFAWRLLLRSIQRPLTAIRQSIHALSEGRFDTRMSVRESNNELSMLADDFNVFAENTEQTINALHEARQSLEVRKEHIQAILNGVPEAVLTLAEQGTILDGNPAAERVFGASLDEMKGESVLLFFNMDNSNGIDAMDDLAARVEKSAEFEGIRRDGSALSMWVSLSHIDSGEWVCVISDVTAWKQTEQQLQQLTVEQDAILENAIIGIAFLRDRKVVRVNHRFEQLFGVEREKIVGESTQRFYPNEQAYKQFGERAYIALTSGDSYEAQLELVKADGSKFWCAVSGKAIDPDKPANGTIWLFEDVTKQRENEEYLTELASIDSLTGLPNRNVFNDRVEHAVHRALRDSSRLAVFFLDLDHFKTINDSMGHKAGDVILKAVASRIKSCLREGDTVARLGGDEFTLLLEDVRSAEDVGKIAEKIIHAILRPYNIETTEITISPSIGISLYPADGRDGDMLIRNADAAMYHAKKLGRNNFQFYSAEMNAEAAERLVMENALRRAVENDELFLHYQAQHDLVSGQLIGAEALLRWHTADWGYVSPARFVPILEDSGLIGVVGERVLSQACDTFMALKDLLPQDFKMAVNLSGRQFKGGNLASDIRYLLKQSGMPATNLELEITESMLMEDTQLATLTLRELSQMGISLAIDDFGTGYSSLSYLKQFPLNVLKIDGSFIRDLTTDKEDAAIVDAIMAISASLGLTVVAEGVETREQLDYLKQHYCQRAQGFLLSRPLDKADFAELVRQKVSP